MDADCIIQGRTISPADWLFIRSLLAQNRAASRYKLSRLLCQLWDWRDPKGPLKDMAARSLLLKLEERGWIILPAQRRASPNRMRHQRVGWLDHARQPITGSLAEWIPLPVPVSCLLFGSAAWQCAARDQVIGWSAAQRERALQQITNNTRFLILPWVQVGHLASHVLSRVLHQLRADWQSKYSRALHLLETLVDTSRFVGASYRAANWIDLGPTTGRTRQDRWSPMRVAPKRVLVYPLTKDFRGALRSGAGARNYSNWPGAACARSSSWCCAWKRSWVNCHGRFKSSKIRWPSPAPTALGGDRASSRNQALSDLRLFGHGRLS